MTPLFARDSLEPLMDPWGSLDPALRTTAVNNSCTVAEKYNNLDFAAV